MRLSDSCSSKHAKKILTETPNTRDLYVQIISGFDRFERHQISFRLIPASLDQVVLIRALVLVINSD